MRGVFAHPFQRELYDSRENKKKEEKETGNRNTERKKEQTASSARI